MVTDPRLTRHKLLAMKHLLQFLPFTLLAILFTGCLEDECQSTIEYFVYDPIILGREDFRTDITATTARELCQPSGFYVYGDYLLVVEYNDGLHILDNSDPSAPRTVSYLPVGGAVGLAVRNDILYINNYVDLLTFDLQDPTAPNMLHRAEEVFETNGVFNPENGYDEIVIGYVQTPATRTIDCQQPDYGQDIFIDFSGNMVARRGLFSTAEVSTTAVNNALFTADLAGSAGGVANSGGPQPETVGVGGSLARFTISNQTLFSVSERQLKAYDLTNPAEPVAAGTVDLDWGVETIFPNGDELYLGTVSGMHIMDASDPLNPTLLSTIEHVRACDPVVVSGNRAYVTLSGGSACRGFTNQLDVIDVTDKTSPNLIESYPMSRPVGLSVGNQKLFICEPGYGLQILELDEEGLPTSETSDHPEYQAARDIIGLHPNRHLITIGEDGIRQIRYNDAHQLQPLSRIEVCDAQ